MTIILLRAHFASCVTAQLGWTFLSEPAADLSLPLLLGWHGPSKWCRDLWCAKIESKECHLRWRKGNSAWGGGELGSKRGGVRSWCKGTERGVSRGRWRGNGDIFEGRHCCSHRVSGSIDLRSGCVPTRANAGSSPVHSVQLESFAVSHSRAMISTHAETNHSRYSTNAAWEYIAVSPPAKRLKRPVNPLPAYLFSSEFDQDLWHALFIESLFFFFFTCLSLHIHPNEECLANLPVP